MLLYTSVKQPSTADEVRNIAIQNERRRRQVIYVQPVKPEPEYKPEKMPQPDVKVKKDPSQTWREFREKMIRIERARDRSKVKDFYRSLSMPARAKQIYKETCEKYKVNPAEVYEKRRGIGMITVCRHEIMYRFRHELLYPLQKIGKMLLRDHTTCLHGIRIHARKHDLPAELPEPEEKKDDQPEGE